MDVKVTAIKYLFTILPNHPLNFTDLCDLNLNATDTAVCRGGADKVVSFFVAPPSINATAIDCPISPFLVKRKFDCEPSGTTRRVCKTVNTWWGRRRRCRNVPKPDFPEPPANARVCYYCFSNSGDKNPNNDEYVLIRTCDTLNCVADDTDNTMMNLSCNCI